MYSGFGLQPGRWGNPGPVLENIQGEISFIISDDLIVYDNHIGQLYLTGDSFFGWSF